MGQHRLQRLDGIGLPAGRQFQRLDFGRLIVRQAELPDEIPYNLRPALHSLSPGKNDHALIAHLFVVGLPGPLGKGIPDFLLARMLLPVAAEDVRELRLDRIAEQFLLSAFLQVEPERPLLAGFAAVPVQRCERPPNARPGH